MYEKWLMIMVIISQGLMRMRVRVVRSQRERLLDVVLSSSIVQLKLTQRLSLGGLYFYTTTIQEVGSSIPLFIILFLGSKSWSRQLMTKDLTCRVPFSLSRLEYINPSLDMIIEWKTDCRSHDTKDENKKLASQNSGLWSAVKVIWSCMTDQPIKTGINQMHQFCSIRITISSACWCSCMS